MSKTKWKPDTSAKGSYTQMFLDNENKHFIDAEKALTYNEVLSWGGRKHSEFMTPFSRPDDDYMTMDMLWPNTPPWLEDEDDEDFRNREEFQDDAAYRFNCIISCERFVRDCGGRDPVRCWYGAVTGSGSVSNWEVIEGPGGVFFRDRDNYVWIHPGGRDWFDYLPPDEATFDMVLQYNDTGSGSDQWYYHPLMGKWILILAGSSTCTYTVTFLCCNDRTGPVFDDDATADTVAAGGSVTAYLDTDFGTPPFEWTIEGEGWSLSQPTTTNHSNVVIVDSNTCDTPVGASETNSVGYVTVTDFCEYTVEFAIRHADGAWHKCHGATKGGCSPVGGFSYYMIYQDAGGTYDPGAYRMGGICGTGTCWVSRTNNLVACGNPVDWFTWTAGAFGCAGLDEIGVWDWRC